jgi:NADPH2:quinone reductase
MLFMIQSDLNNQNNRELVQMYEKGLVRPHIHKVYPLSQAANALNDLMQKKVSGKVVLSTSI